MCSRAVPILGLQRLRPATATAGLIVADDVDIPLLAAARTLTGECPPKLRLLFGIAARKVPAGSSRGSLDANPGAWFA